MNKDKHTLIAAFFGGIITGISITRLSLYTQKLLTEKPDQCPYCGFYLDEED